MKSMMLTGLVVTAALVAPAYAAKVRSKDVSGVYLINTKYTAPVGSDQFGNLVLFENGTFLLHTTFEIANRNGLPMALPNIVQPGGNFSVMLAGVYKKINGSRYCLCGASVITNKEEMGNMPLARWGATGEFTIKKGRIEGAYTTTLYAPEDTKLKTPVLDATLQTEFEGRVLCCQP